MFWQNYLKQCEIKGVAPNTAARAVGIKSSATVTGWKKGAKPRDSVVLKLSNYFGCTVEDLKEDEKTPAIPKNDGIEGDSAVKREELKRLVDRLTDQEVADYLSDFRRTILGE